VDLLKRVVVALALLTGSARAQLASPGELAKPHAALEGMSNCTKCHPAGGQLSAALCLDCHKELKKRVDANAGFHGRLHDPERSACNNCHKDHEGRDFQMVEWKPSKERFDHGRTGWPLKGKHAGEKCASCHEPRRFVDADALALKKRGFDTQLGVGTKCTVCHFDEHRGQLEHACDQCHTEAAWKPAPRFDHAKTDYPLAGLHKKVACARCHATESDEGSWPPFPPPRAASFMKMTRIEHRRCSDCHADPHEGKFGPNCEGCHTVEGWKIIKKTASERDFHEKTRYPLRGLHATVPCVSCHGPFPGRPAKFKNMAFQKCRDCHIDAHSGQLKDPTCERCHTVDGFKPARFEVEDHAKTSYPLDGGHAAVACAQCHPQDAKKIAPPAKRRVGPPEQRLAAIRLKLGRGERCESCHADPHGGQFRDVRDGCKHCHVVESFAKSTFNHDESRFKLTGKHVGAACAGCHRARAGELLRYKPLDVACASCHADVHLGQFTPAACERCHGTDGFEKTSFNHNDRRCTDYPLEGKHAKVKCAGCHTKVAVGDKQVVRYRPLKRDCEECHTDFHHGDFKGFAP
jgi:hypothetical protein